MKDVVIKNTGIGICYAKVSINDKEYKINSVFSLLAHVYNEMYDRKNTFKDLALDYLKDDKETLSNSKKQSMKECKNLEARACFNATLQEAIIRLITICYFRNNELYDKKEDIAVVYRGVSCDVRNSKGELCLTMSIANEVISDNLSDEKFHKYFEEVLNDYEAGPFKLEIHAKEEQIAKKFVSEYLNWAKELIVKQSLIPREIVTEKIESMLDEYV